MDEKLIPIYIGFSKPKNRTFIVGYVFSWAIRLLERTSYSHAYVRWYSDGAEVDCVYEASGTKVHFTSKKKVFDKKAEIVKEYEIKITKAQYKKGLGFSMANAGVDYGMKGALGIGWVYIGKAFGKTWTNPFADGECSWFCNELIAAFLRETGVDIDIDIESMGPKGFDAWLAEYEGATLMDKKG